MLQCPVDVWRHRRITDWNRHVVNTVNDNVRARKLAFTLRAEIDDGLDSCVANGRDVAVAEFGEVIRPKDEPGPHNTAVLGGLVTEITEVGCSFEHRLGH